MNFSSHTLKILGPLFLWLFLFRDFLTKKILITTDTVHLYVVTKYYFNNLLNGTFPFWQPYAGLGKPFIYHFTTGLYNPIVYLIVILHQLGMNYYDAFLVYIIFFYFLGLVGTYLLTKELLNDDLCAYAAYLLLTVSGIGLNLFTQFNLVLLFTPSCWFFFFLLKFAKTFNKGHFLGLVFTLLIIINSYYPFYFFVLFCIFGLIFPFIYTKELKVFVQGLIDFSRKSFAWILLSIFIVCCSLLPFFFFQSISSSEDMISPFRHIERCITGHDDVCFGHFADMSRDEAGGRFRLSERVHWRHLFSHLDKMNYWLDSHFYIPLMVFAMIVVGSLNFLNKKALLFLLMGFLLTLVSLGIDTPVFPFLFEHVPIFKYFRNYYYFMAYLIPLLILFSVVQFKIFMDNARQVENMSKRFFILGTIHVMLFYFLIKLDNVILSSYITLLASMLFFVSLSLRSFLNKRALIFASLTILVLAQPVRVIHSYHQRAHRSDCLLPHDHIYPQFEFTRGQNNPPSCDVLATTRDRGDLWHVLNMRSPKGAIDGWPNLTGRHSYILSQKLDRKTFLDYLRFKFVLYDRLKSYRLDEESLNSAAHTFINRDKKALIRENDFLTIQDDIKHFSWAPSHEELYVEKESDQLRLLYYDVNALQIQTHFKTAKFLVYNESFTSRWRVFVNGKRKQLFRANLAFKGVVLPPGQNVVHFKYEPAGGYVIYIILPFIYCFLFMVMIFFFIKEKKYEIIKS